MPRICFTVSEKMAERLAKEAQRDKITVQELLKRILWSRTWKKRPQPQHWLEKLYARGAPKRAIRELADWFSTQKGKQRKLGGIEDWFTR
jgi:hypothetical protein